MVSHNSAEIFSKFFWLLGAFSLFSVVTFKNLECTTQMSTNDNAMKGICQTAEDCGENNGMASGNCASGFGVCCFYK